MKRREFLKISLEGIVLASAPSILSANENSIKSDLNSNSIVKDNIEYYMQTDRSIYNLGENVEMLYRVTNLRDENVTFGFTCGPVDNLCDYIVEKDGERVWDNLFRDATMALTYFTLKPSESREYTKAWDMTYKNGNKIVPGNYVATGVLSNLMGQVGDYVPVSVTIHINTESHVNEKERPTQFSLQNYPNPFNSSTIIKYQLPENTNVNLDVYNISGQKIKTLVDKVQNPGLYHVNFNANDLSSGIYFYQLKTEDNIKTNKMMLVK